MDASCDFTVEIKDERERGEFERSLFDRLQTEARHPIGERTGVLSVYNAAASLWSSSFESSAAFEKFRTFRIFHTLTYANPARGINARL